MFIESRRAIWSRLGDPTGYIGVVMGVYIWVEELGVEELKGDCGNNEHR